MKLIDTHCHIHASEYADKYQMTPDELVEESVSAGVEKLICVGTDHKSGLEALKLAQGRSECFYSIALHPHESAKYSLNEALSQLDSLSKDAKKHSEKLVAVGETGLDYFYHDTEEVKNKQKQLLKAHIELAVELRVPLIFHVRDAFEDFFEIVDEYEGLKGVVHSFSATVDELSGVLERGFLVGLNGIMTFTKDDKQLEAARQAPLEKIVLETDAPFLTPKPYRGKMCKPKHVELTAEFLSQLRGESLSDFAAQTSKNAERLFSI